MHVANKSEKNLSFPLHITHASFGSIRWCAPTARWMEHVAQAQGLGRTGVEGMVIPVSANCVAHQLTQSGRVACRSKQPG